MPEKPPTVTANPWAALRKFTDARIALGRADLAARREELDRTLAEVDDVTRRCLARLDEIGPAPAG